MKNIYQLDVSKYGLAFSWAQVYYRSDVDTEESYEVCKVFNGDLVMFINDKLDLESLGYPRGEVFQGLHLESSRVVIMYYDYVKSYDDTKSMVR